MEALVDHQLRSASEAQATTPINTRILYMYRPAHRVHTSEHAHRPAPSLNVCELANLQALPEAGQTCREPFTCWHIGQWRSQLLQQLLL